MDSLAKLPADERRVYFEQAAVRFGRLTPQLIEKDFWVCWILRRIFQLADFRDHITFKGGTSLSKVYRVIERFSEDVDLAIERTFLGFGGDQEPERGATGNEQKRRVEALMKACQQATTSRFHPQLNEAITAELGDAHDWKLPLEVHSDNLAILFEYPQAIADGVHPYFAQSVRIELGARSDHFPVESRTIQPYLSETIPEACCEAEVRVRVLSAERTFWEKATILHALCHQLSDKPMQKRLSRHFYDLFQLADHQIGLNAVTRPDLLERVAFHKSVFFKSAWARYDEARPGSLRLVPSDGRISELKADYAAMQPMFFSDAPDFDLMLERLRRLEYQINSQTLLNRDEPPQPSASE